MRGKAVFYPVGWDDNGLPTERRVQNYYAVRCDPSLPYDPDFEPPVPARGVAASPAEQRPVSRPNFVELCRKLTEADERAYAAAWRRLGLSVDWQLSYRTIDDRVRAVSQRAFLRELARSEAYQAEAPALWDVTFGTAVAQAELEDRDVRGAWYRLPFPTAAGSSEVVVATTRPELLPACVALVAHPADERYQHLIGASAQVPVFDFTVPVLAHHLADPGKGTGLAMVCTFGDTTDVTWWRDLRLPTRPVIGRDGRLSARTPDWISGPGPTAGYGELAGQPTRAARRRMADLLAAAGLLRGAPEPVTHPVKFYEHGEQPLEIITTRQWYIRNGGRDEGLRAELVELGAQLDWHPPHMHTRYQHWVDGLAGDWLVSRQRYFGVPIPVWYRLDASGAPAYDEPILPSAADLPVDPAVDVPTGYAADQRDVPGGFTADPDVMDTWATSSLTPQIAGGWSSDEDLFARVFPMDLRPQAHEIIRTWLFYTLLRSRLEHGQLPWRHVAISGWIVDPDRKKMSKSVGNVVTPEDLLREYGSDAVRYWAAGARLGVDAVFDRGQLKIGRRLAVKILNATRFVLGATADPANPPTPDPADPADAASTADPANPPTAGCVPGADPITHEVDRGLLRRLADVVDACTAAFDGYDHALALESAERFFWFFCDDYLELVKSRAYGEQGGVGAASAAATLRSALSVLLRLLAPVLPFATEEAWSWWQSGSIHRADWPDATALRARAGPGDDSVLEAARTALTAIRKAKSAAKIPVRAEASLLTVTGPAAALRALSDASADVAAAGHVGRVELIDSADTDIRHEISW